MDLRNKGVITLHPVAPDGGQIRSPKTLVLTGVARSGTSMVARVLHGAGVYLGENLDHVVFEDNEFSALFDETDLDLERYRTLLRQRDDRFPIWGFKRPHLHVHGPSTVRHCRNPFVVLTVRDAVAIAERNAISEHRDPFESLTLASFDLQKMLEFSKALDCPVMLVSYEKAVSQPDCFVDRLLEFCGLHLDPADVAPLVALVEPDRPAYIESARRIFDGFIDGIRDQRLFGWAWQRGQTLPVTLTLYRDAKAVRHFVADRLRQDLASSGYGDGLHGFSVDLAGLGFTANSRLSVGIQGRSFLLVNSGATMSELWIGDDGATAEPIHPLIGRLFGAS